jgi:hypothetical protein
MIWAYAVKQLTEEGLLELKEVTFDGSSPQFLREIAQFLFEIAARIETGNMNHSHVHIGEVNTTWDTKYPSKDVIVALPVDWDKVREEVQQRRVESSEAAFPLEFHWQPVGEDNASKPETET